MATGDKLVKLDGLKAAYDAVKNSVKFDSAQSLTNAQKAQARENIGAGNASDIISSVVRYDTNQSLTDTQKSRARNNIGAATASDIISNVVRYDASQSLTASQKAQARDNIGAVTASDAIANAVRFDTAQTLTNAQKAQARDNIGAATASDAIANAVRFDTAQTLTDAQKTQARGNIAAASTDELTTLSNNVSEYVAEMMATAVKFIPQSRTEEEKAQARANIGVDGIDNLKSATDAISDTIYDITTITGATTNKYWNVETTTAVLESTTGDWSTKNGDGYISVHEGEIYRITACQGSTDKTRIWVVTDDNNVILDMAENHRSSNEKHTEFCVIPSGGTRLMLTYYSGSSVQTPKATWEKLTYNAPRDRGLLADLGITALTSCTEYGYYRTGAAYVQSVTDLPSDYSGESFTLNVTRPAYANNNFCTQELITVTGKRWYRVLQYTSGAWGVFSDWESNNNNDDNKIDSIESRVSLHDIYLAKPIPYVIGSTSAYIRADTGAAATSSNSARTDFVDVSGYEYLVYSKLNLTAETTNGGTAFYTSNSVSSFISDSGVYCGVGAESFNYELDVIPVPPTANYARFTLRKDATGNFYVKGIKKNILSGLKLSLLGASIEAFAGAIPEGNHAYYTGSNQGINSVDEMWWKVLCNNTGMTPLVIDAWSGSSVAYNYATDTTHSDTNKIPMCSDLRTGRLASNGVNPDIIIVIAGANDWTYSESTTTPLGDWNGRTAIDRTAVTSGQSTFIESYASMIQQLQHNYPNAIIVCSSLEFTCRGTSNGITRLNDMGYTESDYTNAIERVCKIMGVPFIDIYNVGFTFENYYPTYCVDSETEATHPNAAGHAVIAKRFIEELPRLVGQFIN